MKARVLAIAQLNINDPQLPSQGEDEEVEAEMEEVASASKSDATVDAGFMGQLKKSKKF